MVKIGHDLTEDSDSNKMAAWELQSFGRPPSTINLNPAVTMPVIKKPTQVILKVLASSLNRIDARVMTTYGPRMIRSLREQQQQQQQKQRRSCCCCGCGCHGNNKKDKQRNPTILGRDVAGIVTEVGRAVKRFEIGDHVYGFLPLNEQGSQAEYCLADREWAKPLDLSFAQAASIPYVGLTVWTCLRRIGNYDDLQDKKFLIFGGSGGVGSFAIQYLKNMGAQVTTTCSANAFNLVDDLGADVIVDYRHPAHLKIIESHGPYDCILDFAGKGIEGAKYFLRYARPGSGQYITLENPYLKNVCRYGRRWGGLKNRIDLMKTNFLSHFRHRVSIKWGSFSSDRAGWREIAVLVREGTIKPVVEKVYKFSDLPRAYDRMSKGHLRGKIVVEMERPEVIVHFR